MRIALLTDGIYPYEIGGMQKHSYYLTKYLAKSGIHVDLYHTTLDGRESQGLDCFPVELMEFIHPIFITFPNTKFQLPGHYIYRNYLYSEKVLQAILDKNLPDYLYVQGFSGWASLNYKKTNIFPPIVVNFHGLEMFQRPPNLRVRLEHLLLKRPTLINLKLADVTISLGGKLTGLLEKIVNPDKIAEISIGIEKEWLDTSKKSLKQTPSDNRRFLFVGRYERRKGIEELSEVLSKMIDSHKSMEFHFVGNIPVEKKINHERIIYHGLIRSEDDIKDIFAQTDIFISPSHSEGMPTVILEAMASKQAIIATNVGAVSEQVSEVNGWLISPNSLVDIETALKQALFISEQALAEMQNASFQKVKNDFIWDNVIERQNNTLAEKLIK